MAKPRLTRYPRLHDAYHGFRDTRPRRLYLLNVETHATVLSDGQSLRQAINMLAWPMYAVDYMDLGNPRHSTPYIQHNIRTRSYELPASWIEAFEEG